MKLNWFVRKGFIYWPNSSMGWLLLAILATYAVFLFIKIDSASHSVSDTLMNWIFNLFMACLVYSVIGYFTARQDHHR